MQHHYCMELANQLPAELLYNIGLVEQNNEPILLQAPVFAHVNILKTVMYQSIKHYQSEWDVAIGDEKEQIKDPGVGLED